MPRTWILKVTAGALLLFVAALILAQLLLPQIAAQRVRARVNPYGHVRSVHVNALPAVEMLWGKVDSVNVKTGNLRIPLPQMANLLWSARDVDNLNLASPETDLTAAGLGSTGLLLREVNLRKHGRLLNGRATLRESDLRAALPAGFDIQPVASGGGEVQVRVSGALFGVAAAVEGIVSAQEGKLVVQATGIPLASLATLTLFSDPRIYVQGVAAAQRTGGYELVIRAQIR